MRLPSLRGTRVLRAAVAALPFPPRAGFVERGARGYARLAVHTRWLPLFRGARAPTGGLVGGNRHTIEDQFVLKVLNWIDEVRPLSFGRERGFTVEVQGREHLETALAERRGVVLVTGHFGFPPGIRIALEAARTPWLTLRQLSLQEESIPLGEEPWTRVRALLRARRELGWNRACVILADGGLGAGTRVPFLDRQLRVGLGAFTLARVSGSPLLPFFVPLLDRPRHLRVEIATRLDMLPGGDPIVDGARAFARLYEDYVRRYPSSLYWGAGER